MVKLNVRGGAIDVHHHFVLPGGTANRPWSPEMSLEQMDKFGIGVAILSRTQNGDLLYNGTEKGRAAVRAGNEYGARLMQQHPTYSRVWIGPSSGRFRYSLTVGH
jgi:hypothetical protein